MFTITIQGTTLEDFHANLQQLAAQFGGVPTTAPKSRVKKNASAPPTADASDDVAQSPTAQGEPEGVADAELAAELNAPVEPMPETAKAVVDAGTGKPAEQAAPVVQMTFDDVKAAAAKLAAANTPKLVELLKKYGAPNLSGVPGDKLADFASDVLAELG